MLKSGVTFTTFHSSAKHHCVQEIFLVTFLVLIFSLYKIQIQEVWHFLPWMFQRMLENIQYSFYHFIFWPDFSAAFLLLCRIKRSYNRLVFHMLYCFKQLVWFRLLLCFLFTDFTINMFTSKWRYHEYMCVLEDKCRNYILNSLTRSIHPQNTILRV